MFKKNYQGVSLLFAALIISSLSGCIAPDNKVIAGLGTPDVTKCGLIPGVGDGAEYNPRTATQLDLDDDLLDDPQIHPDVFYIGWSTLDSRSDLRSPRRGYTEDKFEDKLFVTRQALDKDKNPTTQTWQLLPQLINDCKDLEQIRIHSFDVAPNGRSLYISMARTPTDNGGVRDAHLAIYRFDFKNYTLTKISNDDTVSYLNPTYIGNDPDTGHEILLVAKTVQKEEIPINYAVPQKAVLTDEYERDATPLIHTMDAVTGDTFRLGFNNSHQTEPFAMKDPNGNTIIGFTQWEHQQNINRFSLWKMQIDGSDNFTLYGDEAETTDNIGNIYQGRVVKTGPYEDYILMGEGKSKSATFPTEGNILMTKRKHLDLRSDKVYLQKVISGDSDTQISRNPEHYNAESFVYSYRGNVGQSYHIYVKDFPSSLSENDSVVGDSADPKAGKKISPETDSYHFVQARSFYLPKRQKVIPTEGDLGQNRVSFTNNNLNGKSGFLVENLTQSDNGEQHQLDGIKPSEISLQFFVPSHSFSDSFAIGLEKQQEINIPASGFISPESDGSFAMILKSGLYMWKMNKRFNYNGENIWLPIRAELQEVSFIPNRVNACNQCHQNRNQANIDKYTNYTSIAATKMRGNLKDVNDISTFETYEAIPDFHQNVVPLLTKPSITANAGEFNSEPSVTNGEDKFYSCIDCHRAGTKLNLSNFSGPDVQNSTYLNSVFGASKLGSSKMNFLNSNLNPMSGGFAPLFWSLLLNDDLTIPDDDSHKGSRRALERAGDYGATYSKEVEAKIAGINAKYNHSKHWNKSDMQAFIIYSNTRLPATLSDNNKFVTQGSGYTDSAAGQKAYQVMLRNCYDCHNAFSGENGGGLEDATKGLPLEKVFTGDTTNRDSRIRFVMHNHIANKGATKFSDSTIISDLNTSMKKTLESARYRIDFDKPEQSELLIYALGKDKLDSNGYAINKDILDSDKKVIEKAALTLSQTAPHYVKHDAIFTDPKNDADYQSIKNWVMNTTANIENKPPIISSKQGSLTLTEYDDPISFDDPISESDNILQWSDPDHAEELAQLFLEGSSTSEYSFNDSMLALDYLSFTSARLKAYAIFGDRDPINSEGVRVPREFRLVASDGQSHSSALKFPVTVNKGDYIVPTPNSTLPNAYAYYTTTSSEAGGSDTNGTCTDSVRDLGELHKLTVKQDDLNTLDIDESLETEDICIGIIEGYKAGAEGWTTVYRRSDRGWLYFMEQSAQKIHVVNELSARRLFTIQLDHFDNKDSDSHKQTQYLLWWRLADGIDYSGDDRWQGVDGVAHTSDITCSSGELQGILESKLSKNLNGDWYVGLGCDESMLEITNNVALSTLTVATEDDDTKGVKKNDLIDPDSGELIALQEYQVRPRYRQKLKGNDFLSVYVWKRATFMTQRLLESIDKFNVLNLFTGKDKSFGQFTYPDPNDPTNTDKNTNYFNVRAVVVAEDGAFYGFNKDLNKDATIFNFDPLEKTQAEITNLPPWISTYLDSINTYGTPFLVIDPR